MSVAEREPTWDEMVSDRADEWAFRIENDLVDDASWSAYCEAVAESWAQLDPPDPERLAEIERTNAEHEAAIAERRVERRVMDYADYLLTPYWGSQRQGALARAQGRCQVCNGDQRLEVHHRTYERRGDEREDDLIVLCRRCHGLYHEHRRLARHGSR